MPDLVKDFQDTIKDFEDTIKNFEDTIKEFETNEAITRPLKRGIVELQQQYTELLQLNVELIKSKERLAYCEKQIDDLRRLHPQTP